MPLPAAMHLNAEHLAITPGFATKVEGYDEPRLHRATERFLRVLSRRTGITVWDAAHPNATLLLKISGPSAPAQTATEDESYRLEITGANITITAANPLGAMHGLQTLLQLVQLDAHGFYIPAGTIEDHPRFAWRGLMLDTSRHFMPIEVIERNLDGMEAVKLNVFHWHLSDDQGFRAESHVLPHLTEAASDGLFYTQQQMREVVEYARDRGIRVIPEFDMPGHTSAVLAAYPELGSSDGPYRIERKWGIFDPALDPTREETFRFIDKLVAEMAAIFPDAYFHIGGDECNGKEWNANPRIREFMREHHLTDDRALQGYFSSRVQTIVAAHGKTAVGWEEILQPQTASDVVIQSWHGAKSLATAAGSNHAAILSKGYYLDLNLSASSHHAIDPLAGEVKQLTPSEQAHIIGGEAAMWTEYISSETVDSRIWPRGAAVAERLWSPPALLDDDIDFYRRLASLSTLLELYGLHHRSSYNEMLARIANGQDVAPLRVLGDVEEPPKQHDRAHLGQYTSFTPLNRMVDAISPESDTGRQFTALCRRILEGKATADEIAQAEALLHLWQQNDSRLRPLLAASALSDDLAASSSALSDAASIGVEALHAVTRKLPTTNAWRAQSLQSLEADAKPHGAMLLSNVEAIRTLVLASSGSDKLLPTPAR